MLSKTSRVEGRGAEKVEGVLSKLAEICVVNRKYDDGFGFPVSH